MEWTIDGGRPVYVQLVEQLERAIVAGEYRAGDKLPSVRDLAAQAAVNPNTMQRALQELETRGLLATQRTAGRTVTDDEALLETLRGRLASTRTARYAGDMRALGFTKQQSIEFLQALEEETL